MQKTMVKSMEKVSLSMAPKRKRVTPEPVSTAPAAPLPKRLSTAVNRASKGLEPVGAAVQRLRPLKVVTSGGELAALLRDGRVLVFDSERLLCEARVKHLCKPQVRFEALEALLKLLDAMHARICI